MSEAPTEAFPLSWPIGWRREPSSRKRAQFGKTVKQYGSDGQSSWDRKTELSIADGTQRVIKVLNQMGYTTSVVISSNLELRNDGLPRSNQRAPADPGVAVYWGRGAKARCIAVDRYDRVADNLAAIAATLEAMRAIERHGGAAILDRAFVGFKALAAPEQPFQVLGVGADATREEIERAFRLLAQKHAYASSGGTGHQGKHGQRANRTHTQRALMGNTAENGLKSKDLMGQPWRVAFALQDAGWYLRQDIIWAKPNPMPESIRDRCTKAHEYLFLLSKSDRYKWNFQAMQEPCGDNTHARVSGWASGDTPHNAIAHARAPGNKRHKGTEAFEAGDERHRTKAGLMKYARKFDASTKSNANFQEAVSVITPGTRNRRSVWTIASEPMSAAHFATFPTELVRPCVLAGSNAGDTVFDPFMGSGTVGQVATDLGRNFIGCELNPDYVKIADEYRKTTTGMAL